MHPRIRATQMESPGTRVQINLIEQLRETADVRDLPECFIHAVASCGLGSPFQLSKTTRIAQESILAGQIDETGRS
jgi:hypothetical protein